VCVEVLNGFIINTKQKLVILHLSYLLSSNGIKVDTATFEQDLKTHAIMFAALRGDLEAVKSDMLLQDYSSCTFIIIPIL